MKIMAPVGNLVRVAVLTLLSSCAVDRSDARNLPPWLVEGTQAGDELTLRQTVTFENTGITVCRTLINASSAEQVIGRVTPAGDNSEQLLTFFLDEQGLPLRDDVGIAHPSFQPPPAPGPEGTSDLYQILRPTMSAENCNRMSVPQDAARIQIISSYGPTLDRAYVPESVGTGRLIVAREYGLVLSNTCWLSVRRRTVRCE